MAPKRRAALGDITNNEQQVQKAADNASSKGWTAYRAAKTHEVPVNKVRRRLHGTPARATTNKRQQKLSGVQEAGLSIWIRERGLLGWGPTRKEVEKKASMIARDAVGGKWFYRFLQQQPQFLYRSVAKQTEARVWALTKPKTDEFFDMLEKVIVDYHLGESSIYAMDETPIPLQADTRPGKRVLVKGKQHDTPVQAGQSSNKQTVTSIETFCADGSLLPPMIIFKGVYHQQNVVAHAETLGWAVDWNAKGSNNGQVMLKWLGEFDRAAKGKGSTGWRLLLVDNVAFHLVDDVLEAADKYKVVFATYPSNATHEMQPHDILAFKTFKDRYNSLLRDDSYLHLPLDRVLFLDNVNKARRDGLQPQIKTSFRKAGVWPVDRTQISRLHLAPVDRFDPREGPSAAAAVDKELRTMPRRNSEQKDRIREIVKQQDAELVDRDMVIADLRQSNKEYLSAVKRVKRTTITSHAQVWDDATRNVRREAREQARSSSSSRRRATAAGTLSQTEPMPPLAPIELPTHWSNLAGLPTESQAAVLALFGASAGVDSNEVDPELEAKDVDVENILPIAEGSHTATR